MDAVGTQELAPLLLRMDILIHFSRPERMDALGTKALKSSV